MKRAAGFTLVELVIALALMSLIMLGLITAMRTLADSGTRVEAKTLANDDMRLVSAFLRQAINAASARPRLRSHDQARVVQFIGARDSLEWVGAVPARQGLGGLYRLRLVSGEGASLMLWMLPLESEREAPDWGNARGHRLLEGLDEYSLQYQGIDMEGWQDGWDDPQVLPARVRIHLTVAGVVWPELLIQLVAAEKGTDPNNVRPLGR